jgi:hypothetical protein
LCRENPPAGSLQDKRVPGDVAVFYAGVMHDQEPRRPVAIQFGIGTLSPLVVSQRPNFLGN